MIQHSAINRSRMLGWIEECLEQSRAIPGDDEIAENFGFATGEAARTLLADLADRGLISIDGAGAGREIRLGSRTKYQAPAAHPKRCVVKPSRKGDPMTRILAITATPAKLATPVAPKPAAPIRAGGPVSPKPAPASPPPARDAVVIGSGAPKPTWHTVGCKVAGETRAQLEAAARETGRSVYAIGGEILGRALASAPEPLARLERKPLIRAAMVAAAQRDGFPLDAFVRILLERGFQTYEADAAAERAA